MADKDLTQGQGLSPGDKTRYVEIESGVYAQLVATASTGGAPEQSGPADVDTFEERAAIDGRQFCRWVNDAVPGAAQTVLTNAPIGDQPGIYYNLSAGEVLYVAQICFGVVSVSDDCAFEFGYTDQPNGEGTFHPRTPEFFVRTGAAPQGRSTFERRFLPRQRFRYADGVRSLTFRVDANDAACVVTCAYHGWRGA